MIQQGLFPDEKVLQLRVVDSGFDVENYDDFKDKEDIQRCVHMPNKESNDKIGVTKEEFEEKMKKDYDVENVEWIIRDEEKHFKLNGVLIRYEFEGNGNGKTSPPHFGFYSVKDKEPNLLSETGYRSHFTNVGDVENYKTIMDYVKAFCESFTKDKKGKVIAEFKFEEVKDVEIEINEEFVARDDLRKWIFKEDKNGDRYRERIIDVIEKIGLEKWFKSKGYPTEEGSVWKNRYTKHLTTLKEECTQFSSEGTGKFDVEDKAYYLWENWLPQDIWNDDELMDSYREGTKEYIAKQLESEENRKKQEKKDRAKARKEGNKVAVTNEENPFKPIQLDLSTTKEDVKKEQEKERQESLCVVCGKKESVCDVNERDKCEDCLKEFFYTEFDKAGLGKEGFKEKDRSYAFFSHTTNLESIEKGRIFGVGYTIISNNIFPRSLFTCDEFGIQSNCFGITEEFFNHLVKEMKLKKTIDGDEGQIKHNGIEMHTKWLNPKISTDEKGKELVRLDKEIALKKVEMNTLLKEKVEILKKEIKR